MNRSEHLSWAKGRALAYLEHGQLENALSSFLSDMSKHPQTAQHMALSGPLGAEGLDAVQRRDGARLKQWIEGFN